MKERPILFSGPMIRALLAGTKTQTRRVCKLEVRSGMPEPEMLSLLRCCPYGQPGDRLWVRETWNRFDGWEGYFYAADDHSFGIGADDDPDHIPEHALRWKPSIHMPRAASRITLEVTGVRVEQLQDISERDARAEGSPCVDEVSGREVLFPDASKVGSWRLGYRTVWESINGAASWAANPYVWVIEFRRAA